MDHGGGNEQIIREQSSNEKIVVSPSSSQQLDSSLALGWDNDENAILDEDESSPLKAHLTSPPHTGMKMKQQRKPDPPMTPEIMK